MTPLDETVAEACRGAAAQIRHDDAKEPGEKKHVTPAVLSALRARLGESVRSEVWIPVPGWRPSPGATDIAIGDAQPFAAVVEVKVYELDWCLWDLAKVASHVRGRTATSAYLIVGATAAKFGQRRRFAETLVGDQTHSTDQLFERYEAAWIDLLSGGSGRPCELPARIRTRVIAEAPLANSPKWELRALRVSPLPQGTVMFVGDWPAGHRLALQPTVAEKGGPPRGDHPQPDPPAWQVWPWRGAPNRVKRLLRRVRRTSR